MTIRELIAQTGAHSLSAFLANPRVLAVEQSDTHAGEAILHVRYLAAADGVFGRGD